ncbi:hypothetical protein [Nonomuraea sp. NPDC050783]|uniref:hypothetical protein n=1 Tax=Nonomuraea sp. NPDC050783 TaxID=3154634 RepID=UPI00346686CF
MVVTGAEGATLTYAADPGETGLRPGASTGRAVHLGLRPGGGGRSPVGGFRFSGRDRRTGITPVVRE